MNLLARSIVEIYIRKRILDDGFQPLLSPPKKKRQMDPRAKNLWETNWGKLILDPRTKLSDSKQAEKFRKRFRLPFPLYWDHLVPVCKHYDVFELKKKSQIPVEFRILIALRMLGRDHKGDDIAFELGIGESTAYYIFQKFVYGLVSKLYGKYIHFLKGEKLINSMEIYRRLGFPGACGSMDCTHVRWNKAPKVIKNECIGKEHFPTLTFQVIVDHNTFIQHVSDRFYGKINDKTIVENDYMSAHILNGFLGSLEYSLYDSNGISNMYRGGYLLVDGGYIKKACFIDSDKCRVDRQSVLYSETHESVRKDIECLFGRLKPRWRYLKNPIDTFNADTIEAAMKAACMLHNMILIYDKGDLTSWEDVDWEKLNPDDDIEESISTEDDNLGEETNFNVTIDTPPNLENTVDNHDVNSIANATSEHNEIIIFQPNSEFDYHNICQKLLINFAYQYSIGQVKWPRNMSQEQIRRVNIPDIVLRTNIHCGAALYGSKSIYVSISPDKKHIMKIDDGLFSNIDYKPNDFICKFEGKIISYNEAKALDGTPEGGYLMRITKSKILNCYDTCKQGICKASLANDPANLFHKLTKISAVDNAKIKFNSKDGTYRLYATKCIPRHTEIFWKYGNSYNINYGD